MSAVGVDEGRNTKPANPTRIQVLLMATSEAIQKGTFYVTICQTLPQSVGGVLGPDMVYTVTLPECRVWIMHPRIKPPMLLVPPTSSIFDPTLDPNFEFEWQNVPLHTHSNAIMKRDQKVVCMGLRVSWHTLTHTMNKLYLGLITHSPTHQGIQNVPVSVTSLSPTISSYCAPSTAEKYG